jgi:hypothetical protein
MLKLYSIFLIIISTLYSACTICPSDKEFYSILLNGSWSKIDLSSDKNNEKILTFIDSDTLKFNKGEEIISYKYEMDFSELSLYDSDNKLIAKYKIKFTNENKRVNISKIGKEFNTGKDVVFLEGDWKRYQ